VFWAERVTVRRRMGCSPYFAATGTHPLLTFDIAEANYLLPPPDATLSTTDLITRRAIALQKRRSDLAALHDKVYNARLKAAARFEKEHEHSIKDFNFKLGDLVLVRNTAIEKALNRKMRARYLGPLIVISWNKGGVYTIAELNGSVFDCPVAAFRVIPYFAGTKLDLPPLDDLIDISRARLEEMKDSTATDPEEDDEEDFANEDDWGQSLAKVRRRSRPTNNAAFNKKPYNKITKKNNILFISFIYYSFCFYLLITIYHRLSRTRILRRNSPRHIAQSLGVRAMKGSEL
jgi:hypothetical protein